MKKIYCLYSLDNGKILYGLFVSGVDEKLEIKLYNAKNLQGRNVSDEEYFKSVDQITKGDPNLEIVSEEKFFSVFKR